VSDRDGLVSTIEGNPRVARHKERRLAIETLRDAYPADAVPVLIACLRNPEQHWSVREKAAEALGALGDASAIPALRDSLNDPMRRMRDAARHALLSLGDDGDNALEEQSS
jgi:HEAT repeat protein